MSCERAFIIGLDGAMGSAVEKTPMPHVEEIAAAAMSKGLARADGWEARVPAGLFL